MSTPQGPNGAEQGHPGRKPEERNGHSVPGKEDAAPTEPKAADASGAERSGGRAADGKPAAGSPAPAAQSGAAPSKGAPQSGAAPSKGAAKDEPAAKGDATQAMKTPAQNKAAASEGDGDAKAAKPAPAEKDRASHPEPSQVTRPVQQGRPTGGQTPPWQRGPQGGGQGQQKAAPGGAPQSPQNVPQTNVPGVGSAAAKNAAPAKNANRPGGAPQRPAAASGAAKSGAPKSGPATGSRPVVTGTAAAKLSGGQSADRSAAKAKAAVIDGPTRHIERKDLAKDLPDLSAVKHPAPAAAAAPAGKDTAHASPTVIPAAASGDPLRATVQVRRIDPWSMLKVSSVISVSLFFVWMIAVGLLYGVLAGMGVWERLNSAFTDIVSDTSGGGLITAGQVFGYATVIGLANTVLITALATLGAFIYNLCTDLVGGVQVTLADPD